MAKRFYGWKRQAHDPRDWQFVPSKRLLAAAALTPYVDLSAGLGEQLDQGQLGSCGPNTADELIEFDQKLEGQELDSASRLFIYYNTRALMGTAKEDSGVDNRTMLQALAQSGFCSESMWPYDVSKFTTKPPANCYQAAITNRIKNYVYIPTVQSHMRAALIAGHPFMFGFDCYQQLESDQAAENGIIAGPSAGETPIGGHDITFCGCNFTGKDLPGVKAGNIWPNGYWKFRNHWMNGPGQPWGDGGYGYMPAGYAHNPNLASDFWAINAVPALVGIPESAIPIPGLQIFFDVFQLINDATAKKPLSVLLADVVKIETDLGIKA